MTAVEELRWLVARHVGELNRHFPEASSFDAAAFFADFRRWANKQPEPSRCANVMQGIAEADRPVDLLAR